MQDRRRPRCIERSWPSWMSLKEVVDSTDKKFLYAENFVYATPVQKAAEIIRAKKSKVLFMKGEESLKGSSSPVAGKWNKTGGGILVRTGTHPLTGMLWAEAAGGPGPGRDHYCQECLRRRGRHHCLPQRA